MSSRERFLAIVLIVAIVSVAGGFLGYQFVYKPYRQYSDEIVKLEDEVQQLEEKRVSIEAEQYVFETKTRKKSLPQEVTVAQREYERLIDRMLRQAKLTGPVITPRSPDSKSDVPLLTGKKPAFTKLDYEVQVKGELPNLVDFLYTFYRQPLLHQVRKFTINKPTRSRVEGATSRELEMTMTIEALVLDRAEDRRTLLPALPATVLAGGSAGATGLSIVNVETGLGSPFTASGVLARTEGVSAASSQKEYRRLADKNIFFDPPRIEPKLVEKKKDEEPAEVREKEPDLAPYLYLTRVSHSDGRSAALVFDRLRKQDYEIETNSRGEVKVTHFYYLRIDEPNGAVSEVRKKISERPYLQFGSEEGGNLRRYTVHRILESELVLEPYDASREKMLRTAAPLVLGGSVSSVLMPKQLTLWRVGQFLSNEDPKRSVKSITYNWEKQELLQRPLAIDNAGQGDGKKPPEGQPASNNKGRTKTGN